MRTVNDRVRPKNGATFQVLIVARISTENQDRRSLEDQIALCKRISRGLCDGKIEYKTIESVGSGEVLDRESFVQMEEEIETGKYDLVISEDLARICRRMRAYLVCETCEDKDTRLYAINDHVDTLYPGQNHRMVCLGVKSYHCWNAVSLDAAFARSSVVDAVWSLMEQHPGFDAELLREISRDTEEALQESAVRQHQLSAELQKCERRIARLLDLLADDAALESPKLKLAELEQQKRDLSYELDVLQCKEATVPKLPPIARLRDEARRILHEMPKDSPEFLRAMQRLVRDFHVWVVRPLDGDSLGWPFASLRVNRVRN